ncbi:MAG: hypothetical protein EPN57_27435 [Paraburkholderia sp.]|nr:MAG: hypothetical protein EPN57_27435 [Paraburkholderia sp.]
MSTPTTKLTVARPTVAPAPTGPAATPAQVDAGAAEARQLSGPLELLARQGVPPKKWTNGSFRASKSAAGAPPEAASSSAAATAAPFVPTGYSLPPGVAGPSMQNSAQMPPQVRQPPMPMMQPNRPMRPPMFNDGQSPLHHLWNSLVKIGESMSGLIQAIARAMANVH